MKNIYQKIGLILAFSFLVQIICVVLFYRHVIVNKMIEETINQDNARQVAIQQTADVVIKNWGNKEKIQASLKQLSEKYNASFAVKDESDSTVYFSSAKTLYRDSIPEHTYFKIDNGEEYNLYGNFPARINVIEADNDEKSFRIMMTCTVLLISIIVTFLIYKVLADPLRKLGKSVENIDYGNTLVTIPYYENDEIGLLCRIFEKMGRRLKKSEENQKELIQAVSHDIKTPLTSIMGYSKRLIEGKVGDDKKDKYYEIIYKKAIELKNLLSEFDEYSSLDSEEKYFKKSVNYNEYFNALFMELKDEFEQTGANISINNLIKQEHTLNIDINKINRIFTNIINNSLKYASSNVNISITCFEIHNRIRFEILDDGEGVPERLLSDIFDRFYRVDTSRSREKGGTGLGLAICKNIVENHNGEIGAYNSKQGGLCIWFELPLENVQVRL